MIEEFREDASLVMSRVERYVVVVEGARRVLLLVMVVGVVVVEAMVIGVWWVVVEWVVGVWWMVVEGRREVLERCFTIVGVVVCQSAAVVIVNCLEGWVVVVVGRGVVVVGREMVVVVGEVVVVGRRVAIVVVVEGKVVIVVEGRMVVVERAIVKVFIVVVVDGRIIVVVAGIFVRKIRKGFLTHEFLLDGTVGVAVAAWSRMEALSASVVETYTFVVISRSVWLVVVLEGVWRIAVVVVAGSPVSSTEIVTEMRLLCIVVRVVRVVVVES